MCEQEEPKCLCAAGSQQTLLTHSCRSLQEQPGQKMRISARFWKFKRGETMSTFYKRMPAVGTARWEVERKTEEDF